MAEKKITPNQENHIADFIKDAVRAGGFSEHEAQEIIKAGEILQEQVKPILQKLAIVDQCFGPAIREFEFTVPCDYKYDTQIDTFAEKTKKLPTTRFFHNDLSSKNFAKATNKLESGKTYGAKIFPILGRVTSEDCITFCMKQNVILVGGQVITLLCDQKPEQFPVDRVTVSFDKKDALWTNSHDKHMVPCVFLSDDYWEFDLGCFEHDWNDNFCLLCIYEL